MKACSDCVHFKKEDEGGTCQWFGNWIPDPDRYSCDKFAERRRGALGFRLGPVRRAVYGFLEGRPSSEPANAREAQPVDELEKMANEAARKYREKVEKATETYRRRWLTAMRQ